MAGEDEIYVVDETPHNLWVEAVHEKWGFGENESRAVASHTAQAARHGQHSHDALKWLHLMFHLLMPSGVVVPKARYEHVSVSPALEVWDGNRMIGPALAYEAVDQAVHMAGEVGIGAVAVYNANHFLWGGDYALRGAGNGCITIVTCQGALAEVAPFGGSFPAMGTNPISIAVPGGFLLDFSTAVVSRGTVQRLDREGGRLPTHAALDVHGYPTRDPAKASVLLPFGGYKGSALALFIELLFASVGCSLPRFRCQSEFDQGERNTPGFFFLAMSLEHLAGEFPNGRSQAENVAAVLESILACNHGARMPGESKTQARESCQRHGGLLFSGASLKELAEFGEVLNVPFPVEAIRPLKD